MWFSLSHIVYIQYFNVFIFNLTSVREYIFKKFDIKIKKEYCVTQQKWQKAFGIIVKAGNFLYHHF